MRIAILAAIVVLMASPGRGQEGVFLSEDQAPAAVFPDADHFARSEVESTPALRERMSARLDGVHPSLWEERYVVFTAARGATPLGQALVVEEIGKHRPITFVVGLRPDRSVTDVAVMDYREAYGGEVRSARFLRQYRGKGPSDALRPGDEITSIAGATLSVEAASRAVRKAQALSAALDQAGDRQ